ncbi:hypothetical protein GF378_02995 [Candidatus Pacearchaeota archaeon]|nr:hypothetical protein [Candidatus Pacearchaeota archaeon]
MEKVSTFPSSFILRDSNNSERYYIFEEIKKQEKGAYLLVGAFNSENAQERYIRVISASYKEYNIKDIAKAITKKEFENVGEEELKILKEKVCRQTYGTKLKNKYKGLEMLSLEEIAKN